MKLKLLLIVFEVMMGMCSVIANPVIVKMNAVSRTMAIKPVDKDEKIEIKVPNSSYEYNLNLDPGQYEVTGYGTDGNTVNGKIIINVTDSVTTQQFTIITCTAYVTNKLDDGATPWNIENGDYSLDVKVNTREGQTIMQTYGLSVTKNRYTFLALNGATYNVAFKPNEKHQAEGYMTLYRGGTLTANVNVTGAIPMGGDFSITIPAEAELEVGMKFTHFTDFTPIKPTSKENANGGIQYNFTLANGQVYNYRTWKSGGLTHGGYFTMNTTDSSQCPVISFTDSDYSKADPKATNHSPQNNNGYETGDLLLNINPQHHLKLEVGDEFLVHGMRMWELTDNSTNNYFFEPDFHYTVLDVNFQPSNSVIEIDNANTTTSAWSRIKAKSRGTAIVMVTYDGINLNYYNKAEKREYLGGEYWGAIWPENTGVFVVTVGEGNCDVIANMTVNEDYNMDTLRLAGNKVDAEHDVFYFLDDEDGYYFTFAPENVSSLDIAVPHLSESEMKFTGFSKEGVVENEDKSYTILLKEGKTIVRMKDSAGKEAYQVLRAKPCHREITNLTRPGSSIFQPGDNVKIQYSGLFHPANKIAGIYNMSAYVTYNGKPNGSSLILGSGQYTFGSAPSAQAVTVEIPFDYNVVENPQFIMDRGVIQVNGYGDPIGNHRNTSPTAGRSPNFTAVPHKTYFGSIPDVKLKLNPFKFFNISLQGLPEKTEVTLSFDGSEIFPDEQGIYSGTYGTYSLVACAEGYKCFRGDFTIDDDSGDNVVFPVEMQLIGDAWDGYSKKEPDTDEEGRYLILNGAELAWFAEKVNTIGGKLDAFLLRDIELGNFNWNPIGTSSNSYTGSFSGQGHKVSEIFVDDSSNYRGLFGYINNAEIEGLIVEGHISGKQYIGGLAGYVMGESSIDRCANYASVKGTGTYTGGLIGYLNSANATVTDCYNAGLITGTTNCGGVIGNNNPNATITGIFNVGSVTGTTVGGCVGGSTAKTNLKNAFSTAEYQITTNQTLITEERMASGEIAYILGEAFGQTIGLDPYPLFDGRKVFYDPLDGIYYNEAENFVIDPGFGNENVTVSGNRIIIPTKRSYTLSVKAIPDGARLPKIEWVSSDPAIVSLSDTGVLTAESKGDAVISVTAQINDSVLRSECNVTVISESVSKLMISQKDINLFLVENPSTTLTAIFSPQHADIPELLWRSDNSDVVRIEKQENLSAKISAIAEGSAKIYVYLASNKEIADSCNVRVGRVQAKSLYFERKDIVLDIDGINENEIKASFAPYYSYEPDVTWCSSDNNVIEITSVDGLTAKVRPIGAGKAELRVEAKYDPEISDVCNIYVKSSISSTDRIQDEQDLCNCDVYDLNGNRLLFNATIKDIDNLIPGLYIIKTQKGFKKIMK